MSDTTLPPPPAPARRWTTARIAGHGFMGFWILLAGVIGWAIFGDWDSGFLVQYAPRYLNGLTTTLQLVGLAMLFGALLSLPITWARLSSNRLVGALAFGWVYFFRGTPLLAQTFLVYYGAGTFRAEFEALGLWPFFRDAFFCAVFTFSLNTSAYQAEILAGSIRNVARGQREAAAALGLSRYVTMRKIVLPQAFIVSLRPYGNEIILMIKGSAIASIVTVFDLMGETRRIFSRTFDFEAYFWAAVLYLVMVELIRRLWDRIERHLTQHLVRRTDNEA
ncbi:ABC transporter permease [Methylobrevis albus]|uniref:ABC transporter permease n=1 Tax=Methylobrevis albus TaxID=2793297 RepID=A0A931I0J7_9HYPH|nr:ABC transporter permease [Methylobrevis albus]MBH0237031.1 ABC transporter permease [Methylobrevis albus]